MPLANAGITRIVWAFLPLAAITYFFGISSVDIPSNGDEHVYLHIARMTLDSGHWLPLQSAFEHVRNTKPPLLFWQAMMTGAPHWTLAALRWPSVVYTLLTAVLTYATVRRLGGEPRKAALAALVFLGCYSVFRYGRPLLTDAPESFWLALAVLPLVWRSDEAPALRYWQWASLGAGLGIACLYKSFVLVIPVGIWWCWSASQAPGHSVRSVVQGAAVGVGIALSLFALWPLMDPEPGAILREFVLSENVGKIGAASHYLAGLVVGGNSVPALFGALLADGGALAPLLLGFIVCGWTARHRLTEQERALWRWILVLFLFFCLPGQRSGRYLLPLLPALCVLGALRAEGLARIWTALSGALVALVVVIFLVLTALVSHENGSPITPGPMFWTVTLLALGSVGLSLTCSSWRLVGAPGASILLMLAMSLFLRSYDRPPGPFSKDVIVTLAGKQVVAPCDFLAAEEPYRFLLPGADIRSYNVEWNLPVAELASSHHYFVARGPYRQDPQCEGCVILGRRVLVHGRMNANEWRQVLAGHVLDHLLVQDTLIEGPSEESIGARNIAACAPEGNAWHAGQRKD